MEASAIAGGATLGQSLVGSNSANFHKSVERLYDSTSWSVLGEFGESYEMDQFLKGLHSPAHQALFVIQHAISCTSSVSVALPHCLHFLKPSHQFIVPKRRDPETNNENERIWPCVSYTVIPTANVVPEGWTTLTDQSGGIKDPNESSSTNMQVPTYCSKEYVSQVVSLLERYNSESSTCNHQEDPIQQFIQKLIQHLHYTLGTDLRNGAAAEAAFDLSLAGVVVSPDTGDLYSMLAHIAALELERKSGRSLRPASILRVVEKLAASGLQNDNPYAAKAFAAAYRSLTGNNKQAKKGTVSKESLEDLRTGRLQLFSFRSLHWLWRRGHLFHKVSSVDKACSLSSIDAIASLDSLFADPTLPLVVDVGCGLGVTLLGLTAGQSTTKSLQQQHLQPMDWSQCNFLGAELSSHAVRWGNAMAKRWEVSGRCHFLHVSTATLLDYLHLESDRSHLQVACILLQFPTPYRLQGLGNDELEEEEEGQDHQSFAGNNRLPLGPTDEAFMANPQILQRMVDLLNAKVATTDSQQQAATSGHLLVQSNCEDVALYIYDTVLSMGLEAVKSQNPRIRSDTEKNGSTPTARTKEWLRLQREERERSKSQETIRRAQGDHWSSGPILPVCTETEASCQLQNTPVHRCLFRATQT
ncbi:expressed unknown protein [Seminavis robusta]|uniref:tRNA (guanine(46)-N(7))-methyltransferase n=1 Tax=Seminavis robusta TaxID=568900 RepID=A0A9N8HDR2_9STRA|nr:expressed unknown protein [Seminavis robusta]|eukprot:Sro474_g150290.1 n/a (642) ;mRNA; r:54650-56575